MPNLKGRSLISLLDYTKKEIAYLIELSQKIKKQSKKNKNYTRLKGKTLALIFEKRSTRTRCAFETAIAEEGGHPVFLSTEDIQLGSKESIEDTARVLGRMFSAIEFRGYKQETIEILEKQSGIPVYNGLTDKYHPTQALADILTIKECFNSLENIKMAYIGDGRNNVCNSLLIACSIMGINLTIISPESLFPDKNLITKTQKARTSSGCNLLVTSNLKESIKDIDVIYTDVWISMGDEKKSKERLKLLKPFQINMDTIKATGKEDCIFMHCLPAVKGNEVSEEVFESKYSRVFDQAENRKHTIKALMLASL